MVDKAARSEKWCFDGAEIEVVNRYKYLGTWLLPTFSMEEHFRDKLTKSKVKK